MLGERAAPQQRGSDAHRFQNGRATVSVGGGGGVLRRIRPRRMLGAKRRLAVGRWLHRGRNVRDRGGPVRSRAFSGLRRATGLHRLPSLQSARYRLRSLPLRYVGRSCRGLQRAAARWEFCRRCQRLRPRTLGRMRRTSGVCRISGLQPIGGRLRPMRLWAAGRDLSGIRGRRGSG